MTLKITELKWGMATARIGPNPSRGGEDDLILHLSVGHPPVRIVRSDYYGGPGGLAGGRALFIGDIGVFIWEKEIPDFLKKLNEAFLGTTKECKHPDCVNFRDDASIYCTNGCAYDHASMIEIQ